MRILAIIWPALLPMLIYGIWCVRRYKRKQAGEDVPPLSPKFFLAVMASLAIGAVCLLVLGAGQERNSGKTYHPARYENGKLVPAGMGQ